MYAYDFLKANSVDEAIQLLNEKENVKLIAGGTDVLVGLHEGDPEFAEIDYLLDISSLKELKKINVIGKQVEIGSLVTHNQLCNDELFNDKIPFLAEAARTIGSTQIRNRATIGGNVCNASPAADLFPPLLALSANVILLSKDGERELPMTEFITGPYRTDLKENELLKSIRFALPEGEYYCNFQKIGRRKALNISRLCMGFLAVVENGELREANLVPGAATPTPTPFNNVNAFLTGKKIAELEPQQIGEMAAEEMVSITGERWSTPYKRPALTTLARRAIELMKKEAGLDE